MNLITPDITSLTQTLQQLLQENELNQTKIRHLETITQLTQSPKQKMQKVFEDIKPLLSCVNCGKISPYPIVVGSCGHIQCPPCKRATVFKLLQEKSPLVCPKRGCGTAAIVKEVPLIPLHAFISYLKLEESDSGFREFNLEKNESLESHHNFYYIQHNLALMCVKAIFLKLTQQQLLEGFIIRISDTTEIFLNTFCNSLERNENKVTFMNYYKRRIFLGKLVEDIPRNDCKPNQLCIVDVKRNGFFTIKHVPAPSKTNQKTPFPIGESKSTYINKSEETALTTILGKEKWKANTLPEAIFSQDYKVLTQEFVQYSIQYHNQKRMEFFKTLGPILGDMPIDKDNIITYTLIARMHKNQPTVACVSNFLSNPRTQQSAYSGFSFEFLIESKKEDIQNQYTSNTAFFDVLNHFLSHLLNSNDMLRKFINRPQFAKFHFPISNLPSKYIDSKGTAAVMVGMKMPETRDTFTIGFKKMSLIPIRLLTVTESQLIDNKGDAGFIELANAFIKDGSYHISKIEPSDKETPGFVEEEVKKNVSIGFFDPITGRDAFQEEMNEAKKCQITFIRTYFPELLGSPTNPLIAPYDKNYTLPLQLFGAYTQFAPPSEIRDFLEYIFKCSQLSGNQLNLIQTMAASLAITLSRCCARVNILHWEAYLNNPQLYASTKDQNHLPALEAIRRKPQSKSTPPSLTLEDFDALEKKLLNLFLQRTEWVLQMQKKAGIKHDFDFCLKVFVLDDEWNAESQYLKTCVEKMSKITRGTTNKLKFKKFQNFRNKTSRWPHAKSMLRVIENSGFKFMPRYDNPDLCICKVCGIAIAGWMLLLPPQNLHDFSKHTESGKVKRDTHNLTDK